MPSFRSLGKKKDKNKNINGDEESNRLSVISQTNSSSVSVSTTEMRMIRPSEAQIAQLRKDKEKEKADEIKNDKIEVGLSGTAVVLGLVEQAAQFTNVPGLQNAANLALGIVTIVQSVKETNRQYKLLAEDVTGIIASIWQAYDQAGRRKDWLSMDLLNVIADLVVTLAEIKEFVEEKNKRGKLLKIFSSSADPSQVLEYRERIRSAVRKFELASHLKMNEILLQVQRDQLKIAQDLASSGIHIFPQDQLLLHALGRTTSGFFPVGDAQSEAAMSRPVSFLAISSPPGSMANITSMVDLTSTTTSSTVTSAATSPATSPPARDQPALVFPDSGDNGDSQNTQGQGQVPSVVVTRADTLPPHGTDGTAAASQIAQHPSTSPCSATISASSHSATASIATSASPTAAQSPGPRPSSPTVSDISALTSSTTLVSSHTGNSGLPQVTHRPSPPTSNSGTDHNKSGGNHNHDNHSDSNPHPSAHTQGNGPVEDDEEDIRISVDATHAQHAYNHTQAHANAPTAMEANIPDPGHDSVRKGQRMPTNDHNRVFRGVVSASPTPASPTPSSEHELDHRERPRGGQGASPVPSDTETLSSERDVLAASERFMQKEQRYFADRDERRKEQPLRTDTNATLTGSERQDTLKGTPPMWRDQEEDDDGDVRRRERRRQQQRQDTEDEPIRLTRAQQQKIEDAYGYDEPRRGPVRRPGPRRYDDDEEEEEEEEERPVQGKGKAKATRGPTRRDDYDDDDRRPQRAYRATVRDANSRDDEDEYEYEDRDDDSRAYNGRRYASDLADGRANANAAVGAAARKAARAGVGKGEELSIKFSKLEVNSQRPPKGKDSRYREEEQYVDEEEDEESSSEEERAPAPSKKRRSKRHARDEVPYGYGGYGYPPPHDPYYGHQHYGYHSPPPMNYYSPPPPPQPRYGPGALNGFMSNLGFGMPGMGGGAGSNTSTSITMSNVGNDNSVKIVNRVKKSRRRD